jgi:hypothetical protein
LVNISFLTTYTNFFTLPDFVAAFAFVFFVPADLSAALSEVEGFGGRRDITLVPW